MIFDHRFHQAEERDSGSYSERKARQGKGYILLASARKQTKEKAKEFVFFVPSPN